MFKVEAHEVGKIRLGYDGTRQEILDTIDALEVGQSFVVPHTRYSAISTRARVSERNGRHGKRFRTKKEDGGTRIIRQM